MKCVNCGHSEVSHKSGGVLDSFVFCLRCKGEGKECHLPKVKDKRRTVGHTDWVDRDKWFVEDSPIISKAKGEISTVLKKSEPKYLSTFEVGERDGMPLVKLKMKEVSVSAIKEATRLELEISKKIPKKILFE